ncbi:hypothetical protein EXIGLDRAFT_775260 [Exidia glandulosa HHB12029]|uniref:BTB domain-containing protein n=1 Tax=Exidia glandulosa HHB12029 TaxID=1314781 RepID=A0A165DZ55_EXIGL|nr:hypothetical protein EXIGLDRAFT_775260 [Exidia glandulosa HHB12029]
MAIQSKIQRALERHPNFYFEKGDLVLEVDGLLCRVHSDFLKAASPIFSTVLRLPLPADSAEGQDDISPVQLVGISRTEITTVLRAVYTRSNSFTLNELLVIFRISAFLVMDDLFQWAIDSINNHVDAMPTPIEKVAYGVYGKVEWWVTEGLRSLVEWPCPQFAIDGPVARILSMDTYVHITTAVEKVRRVRIRIAHTVTDFSASSDCSTKEECTAAWYCHVGSPFQLRYLSLEKPLSSWEAPMWIHQRSTPGLCMSCRLANKGRLSVEKPIWHLEENVIQTAIGKLLSALEPRTG